MNSYQGVVFGKKKTEKHYSKNYSHHFQNTITRKEVSRTAVIALNYANIT